MSADCLHFLKSAAFLHFKSQLRIKSYLNMEGIDFLVKILTRKGGQNLDPRSSRGKLLTLKKLNQLNTFEVRVYLVQRRI